MLFVLGLVAAVGYMFFTKHTIEANIHEQVKEFHAQQETSQHPTVQDSTHTEIKEVKKAVGTKTGKEDMNEALAPKEQRKLLTAASDLQQEAQAFDARGGGSMEPEGIYLEMAVHDLF